MPDFCDLPTDWRYPAELPVSEHREAILAALRENGVLILCGATGSGKSTQLPKLCLEAGCGQDGMIAHTQPRRLAARALAERVAAELGGEAGGLIGWQVRFKSVLSRATRVKFLTDGVLLNELRHDPRLQRYDTVIIDEAHERSLNIDFLLGCLKRLRERRPALRLVITSATLDAEKFSRHFDDAPVIDVAGRSYPIDLRYRPPPGEDILPALAEAVREIWQEASGDILIFLPGEREIREAAEALAGHPRLVKLPEFRTLPLFARLGSARQQEIFRPDGSRRLILATNIAETSLTVPGIRHVIDIGTARISRYSPRSQFQNLAVEPVSRASADQRRGRCGRQAPGICIRLYAEADYAARPAFTDPEIQRTNLAAVLLQMADLRLGRPESFPFVDAPAPRFISDARRLLRQLGALDRNDGLSKIGAELARLPVDPRFGRILLAAEATGVGDAALIICAALSIQDPRLRHAEIRQQADRAQAVFQDPRSDFLSLLNLWHAVRAQRQALGSSAWRRWCQEHFLHVQRLQEWQDLVRQLRGLRHGRPSAEAPDSAALHQALLSGLLDHIGRHETEGDYRGPRGREFRIHPESALGKRRPRWIVAAELVRTRRSYARVVAGVEADWIIAAAGEQVQRRALDPTWDPRRGAVMAREELSLFGLVLSHQRRVPYARHDPTDARRMFIAAALVGGAWGEASPPAFLRDYLDRRQALQAEEARLRRRELLRDEAALSEAFDRRLATNVFDRRSLLRHIRRHGDADLYLTDAELRAADGGIDTGAYPAEIPLGGQRYPLHYRFDPGAEDDGVNLQLPLAALNAVPAEALDWLVPGFLEEKVEALLRGLPKALRRPYVPVQEAARRCLGRLGPPGGDLYAAVNAALRAEYGRSPGTEALHAVELPPRLRMRIEVREDVGRQVAAPGRLVGAGRDLAALRARLAAPARRRFEAAPERARWHRDGLNHWDCGELPRQVALEGGVLGYPHLEESGASVAQAQGDDPQEAARAHRRGQLRLLLRVQERRLKERVKSLPARRERLLQAMSLPATGANRDDPDLARFAVPDLAWACAARAVLELQGGHEIRDGAAFESALAQGAPALAGRLRDHWEQIGAILVQWQVCRERLNVLEGRGVAALDDMRRQAAELLAPGFTLTTPRLADLPRYLQGLTLRAEKAQRDPGADAQRLALYQQHAARWDAAVANGVPPSAGLRAYRWLLEEYRISLFAQPLKTRVKVSPRRLDEAWSA